MHTDSHPLAPTIHRLAAGQVQSFQFRQGSEVFCSQCPLQLTVAPTAWWEDCRGQVLLLAPGQGWRAPQDLWVQLAPIPASARDGAVLVRITPPPEKQSRSVPQGLERLWRVLGRSQGLRRAQRAA